MPHWYKTRDWFRWSSFLWRAGWRPLDLDEIPSYSRRHLDRLSTLLLASMGILIGWICAHQVIAPDVGKRSILWLGGCAVPNALLIWYFLDRLKPSWREYALMYAIGTAYIPLQVLFYVSHSSAAPFLLAGTCFLYLILSNLMMRFRFANALAFSLYITLLAMWLFARQANNPGLVLCFETCGVLVAASTLYLNHFIGKDEMYYMRMETHFRLVLSCDRRDLWEFDPAARVFRITSWNADSSLPALTYRYEDYLASIHPEHRSAVIRVIEDSLSGQTSRFQIEFERRTEDLPEWRWLQLAGHAGVSQAGGAAGKLIGTICDVTDRKSLHARVEQQAREFEQAAREKAEFLATISHSIRTPLNAVIGAASVLSTDNLGGEVREMVDTIQRSGQLLVTVLNDVLDLDSANHAGPQLENGIFKPRQLLRHCCDLIGPLAQRKNLELRLNISPEVSSDLSGDEVRLQQVLINLLSNAVKFTDRGWVGLSASVEVSPDPSVQRVAFTVSDTGVGIEEQAQRSLFERFEQLHTQTIAGPSGTGLGLAISQRLVGAMGGVIGCQSQPGVGSAFSFTISFPVTLAPVGDQASHADRAVPATSSGGAPPLRVLVAEDHPVNQRVLTSMLHRLHCNVEVAGNGVEAVEACRQRSFDVIIMDCDMPVLDGLEATRHIRKLPAFAAVPIIAATAHALPANLDACRRAGMSDTLTKPLTLARLAAALAHPAPDSSSLITNGAPK